MATISAAIGRAMRRRNGGVVSPPTADAVGGAALRLMRRRRMQAADTTKPPRRTAGCSWIGIDGLRGLPCLKSQTWATQSFLDGHTCATRPTGHLSFWGQLAPSYPLAFASFHILVLVNPGLLKMKNLALLSARAGRINVNAPLAARGSVIVSRTH
jgi:hypothetical protein